MFWLNTKAVILGEKFEEGTAVRYPRCEGGGVFVFIYYTYIYIYIYNRVRPGAPAGCVFFPGNWCATRVLGALPQGATFIRLGTCCDRFRGVREAVLEALGVILTCQLSVASCLFYACAQNCSF